MVRNFAIVAIGYNRVKSMARLLESLVRADYDNDKVNLIISIDNSGDESVENYANSFQWPYGEKIIKTYPERMGLRKHVLTCGSFVKDYDAIAVFEDDIIVAPGFYHYMKQAVEFYYNDNRIAGISLYNHLWNVNVNLNFNPEPSKYDIYFLQFAQSWGQVWMKKQWEEFASWYEINQEEILPSDTLPTFVTGWPKTSWLKYHIKFCVEKNKYFVYPYNPVATCFSDVGEHCKIKNTIYQVPLSMEIKKEYSFVALNDGEIRYDVFFERQDLGKYLNVEEDTLCVDLYGTKSVPDKEKARYFLSTKNLDYRIERTYGLDMKPHELNIVLGIPGTEIKLYDLKIPEKNTFKSTAKDFETERIYYYQKLMQDKNMLIKLLKNKIKAKAQKIFN